MVHNAKLENIERNILVVNLTNVNVLVVNLTNVNVPKITKVANMVNLVGAALDVKVIKIKKCMVVANLAKRNYNSIYRNN